MNLIETLVSRATEEACELGKAFSKLNGKGVKAVDSETGQPLILDAIKQLNEILAVVELLRDRGVPLAGIGDPVAVGEAKNLIVQDMEEAMKAGTLTLSEDDQNPRPEGVNEPDTGLPDDNAGTGGDNGEEEGLGADGTGASDADGSADGDGEGAGDGGDDTNEGGDDTSGGADDDSESGEDGGDNSDDSEEEEEESEEEEEEPGTNDV